MVGREPTLREPERKGNEMFNLINLTPHAITFRNATGDHTIEPSGQIARVDSTAQVIGTMHGLPVQDVVLGEIIGLPESNDSESVFIVSGMVLEALKLKGIRRADVIAPATGPKDEAIRNEKGHIVAVTKFNGIKTF